MTSDPKQNLPGGTPDPVPGGQQCSARDPADDKATSAGRWWYDPVTDLFDVDDVAEGLLGYDAGQYPFRTLREHLASHGDRALAKDTLRAVDAFALAAGLDGASPPLPPLSRTRCAGGRPVWLCWQTAPPGDGDRRIGGTVRDLTDRVDAFLQAWRAGTGAARSHRYADAAAEAGANGLWYVPLGSEDAWYSDWWYRIIGHERGDFPANQASFLERVHPDDRARVHAAIDAALTGADGAYSCDFRLLRKDGAYAWMGSRGRVIQDPEAPEGRALVGSQHDISARIETRRALQDAAEEARVASARLERLTENVPGGIYELVARADGTTRFTYATENLARLLGTSRDALLADGDLPFRTMHPPDVDTVRSALKRSFDTCEPFSVSYRNMHPDQGLRWLRFNAAATSLPDGGVLWYGTLFDVTEEIERERAIEAAAERARHLSERLERLTENVPGGLFEFVIDADGKMSFPYVTSGMGPLLGTTREALLEDARNGFRNDHSDDRRMIAEAIAKSAESLEPAKIVYRHRHPALGLRWLQVNGTPKRLPDGGTIWYCSTFDVTDEVEHEQAREMIAEKARIASERLERLTDNVPGGLFEFVVDEHGAPAFTYASSGLGRILGTTNDRLLADVEEGFRHDHPDDADEVQKAIERSMQELSVLRINHRLVHPDTGLRWHQVNATPAARPEGGVIWYGSIFDVSEEMQRAEELERARNRMEALSRMDPLTELPNRRAFDVEIATRFPDAGGGGIHSLIRIDLDFFKAVNDTLGHAAGDAVLRRVGTCLRRETRDGDFFARLGGDEFVVVLAPGRGVEDATATIARLQAAVREPFLHEGRHCRFDASFGLASTETLQVEPTELLSLADAALLEAKRTGRGRVAVFTPDMHDALIHGRHRASEIELAIEARQFVPYFQPQIDAATGLVSGFEVLARWRHPTEGILTPEHFIPFAEQMRLVSDIDRMMFDMALETLTALQEDGFCVPKLAFNVSVGRVHDPGIVQAVRQLKTNGTRVAFELLESILLEDEGAVFEHHIDLLKESGVDIEVDDFGSGRASIIGVLRVDPSAIKIDRRLIAPLFERDNARDLVGAIIDIGRSLNIDITAEGVETLEHAWELRAMGCRTLQGYAFARPMPGSDLRSYLANFQPVFADRIARRRT